MSVISALADLVYSSRISSSALTSLSTASGTCSAGKSGSMFAIRPSQTRPTKSPSANVPRPNCSRRYMRICAVSETRKSDRTNLLIRGVAGDEVLELAQRVLGDRLAPLLLVEVGEAVEAGLLEVQPELDGRSSRRREEVEDVVDAAAAQRGEQVLRSASARTGLRRQRGPRHRRRTTQAIAGKPLARTSIVSTVR